MKFQRALQGRMRHIPATLLVAAIFFTGFAAGNLNGIQAAQRVSITPPPEAEEAFDYFWQTYNLIQSDYIDKVDIETLVDGATQGMVDALEDQYSGYMNPETFDLLNADMSGEIEGIGVVIHTDEETGEIQVVGLLEGSPAAEAGILPGDIFVAVDGEDVIGATQLELAVKVRGPEGTPVTITMRREEELIDFTMNRARIIIPNIESRLLDSDIAYVKLNQFSAEARHELDEAIEALDVNSHEGLIIDFRDNPGGLLSSAVDVASLLVDEGPVVIEDFGEGQEQIYQSNENALDIRVPVVLLVNEGSASASELVAGAWQDTGRVTVIGETTLGKGTVQTWHDLVNGGGVRLTIARWLTPNRRWIHEQGITPDIVVEWTPESFDSTEDPQLDAAVTHLQSLVTATTP
jgi:carboxyl-terminal processing protease